MHHDELLFVAFVASISLVTTIKRIQRHFHYTMHEGKYDVLDCCIGLTSASIYTNKLLTATPSLLVVGPIPQV
jgi:hypothetical protein